MPSDVTHTAPAEIEPATPLPTPFGLFLVFAKVGLTSFGGGLTGWMMHEMVRVRRWMTEDEFLTGLAMAQALPGVNVVNLPIWIGYRIAGTAGAIWAALGVIFPPMLVVTVMAATYSFLSRYAGVNLALQGAAAAAIGLAASMGLRAGRKHVKKLVPCLILIATFVAVALEKIPMIYVVGVMAPVSCYLSYRKARR